MSIEVRWDTQKRRKKGRGGTGENGRYSKKMKREEWGGDKRVVWLTGRRKLLFD